MTANTALDERVSGAHHLRPASPSRLSSTSASRSPQTHLARGNRGNGGDGTAAAAETEWGRKAGGGRQGVDNARLVGRALTSSSNSDCVSAAGEELSGSSAAAGLRSRHRADLLRRHSFPSQVNPREPASEGEASACCLSLSLRYLLLLMLLLRCTCSSGQDGIGQDGKVQYQWIRRADGLRSFSAPLSALPSPSFDFYYPGCKYMYLL